MRARNPAGRELTGRGAASRRRGYLLKVMPPAAGEPAVARGTQPPRKLPLRRVSLAPEVVKEWAQVKLGGADQLPGHVGIAQQVHVQVAGGRREVAQPLELRPVTARHASGEYRSGE